MQKLQRLDGLLLLLGGGEVRPDQPNRFDAGVLRFTAADLPNGGERRPCDFAQVLDLRP